MVGWGERVDWVGLGVWGKEKDDLGRRIGGVGEDWNKGVFYVGGQTALNPFRMHSAYLLIFTLQPNCIKIVSRLDFF